MAKVKKEYLAFYKKSGEPWTLKEVNKVILHCDSKNSGQINGKKLSNNVTTNKYLYDCGDKHNAYYPWSVQRVSELARCEKHDYHEYFGSTLKTYRMEL